MKRPQGALRAFLALALLAAGCVAPLLGSDQEIGAQESVEVERSMGLVADPALQAYLEAIGRRLAAQVSGSDAPYRFAVVDRPEPNAFALPGGYVYVSRGLLALVNSEDELACVIGHEIGHVAARHSARRVNVAAPFAIASGITGFATGLVSPRLGQAVAGASQAIAQGLVVAPYSRHQEREADRIGIELAARAGWDPAAMARLLTSLDREEALAGERRRPGFLDGHPSTPQRVADTTRRAGELSRAPAAPIAADRAALLQRLDGLIVGEDPAQGVFEEALYLQPQLGFAVRFPDGWETLNTPEAVYAVDPSQEASATLHVAGAGTDPRAPARALAEELGRELELRAGPGAARPSVYTLVATRTDRGPVVVQLAWVAHGGAIYQISGVAPAQVAESHGERFLDVARSFRPLQRDELARIRESRLRARAAHPGETLQALVERERSTWSPARTAVANALDTDAALSADLLVKLAIPQPYTRRPH